MISAGFLCFKVLIGPSYEAIAAYSLNTYAQSLINEAIQNCLLMILFFCSNRCPTTMTSTCEQFVSNQLHGRSATSVLYKRLFHPTKDKTNNRQCSIQCVHVVFEQCIRALTTQKALFPYPLTLSR